MSHDDEARTFQEMLPLARLVLKGIGLPRWAWQESVSDMHLSLLLVIRKHDPSRGPLRKAVAAQLRWRMIDLHRTRDKSRSSRRKAFQRVSLGELEELTQSGISPPDAELAASDQFSWMVQSLTPDERAVVVGHFRDGRKLKDIAREIGLSEPRCSQILKQALEFLRYRLAAQQSA